MIIRDLNGFYLKTEKTEKQEQTTIFDGYGIGLGKNKDKLTYNPIIKGIKNEQRLKTIISNTEGNIGNCIVWADFTNPAKNIKIIHSKKELEFYGKKLGPNSYNLGETDNVIIFNTPKLLKELKNKSLALAGAVADCAGICGSYKTGEIISITHAGRQGILNGVIEQLIRTYIAALGKKEFQKVKFDISPVAGINYEWESKFFDISKLKEEKNKVETSLLNIKNIPFKGYKENDKKLLEKNLEKINLIIKIIETYNLDFIKDKIVEKTSKPEKVIFFLDRLIKRIFLENGTSLEQLNFHKDYTTDISNPWPSYRIHSLWTNGIITSCTKKEENGIIYDKRIGIFNIVKIMKD